MSKASSLRMMLLGTAVSLTLAACGQKGADTSGQNSAAAPEQSVTAATTGNVACDLLTLAEVKAVFPDAAGSKAEDRLEAQGIHACDWNGASGARLVQVRVSDSTVEDELGTFEMGVMDPTKPGKLARQPIAGSNGGQVIVGRQDEAKGVLQSVAAAAVQKGSQTVTIVSSDIAARDDAAAALGKLATAAAARLQ